MNRSLLLGCSVLVSCAASAASISNLTGKPGWVRDGRGSLFSSPVRSVADLQEPVTEDWQVAAQGKVRVFAHTAPSAQDLSPEKDFAFHRKVAKLAAGSDYGSDGYCAAVAIGGRVPICPDPESAVSQKTWWLIAGLSEDENLGKFLSLEYSGSPLRQHALFDAQTEVWVNRGDVNWKTQGQMIPKDGFYAKSQVLEGGILLLDGKRRAYMRDRETMFVDARQGGEYDFGGIVTDGALRLDYRDRWRWVVTPVAGQSAFVAMIDPKRFGRDGEPFKVEFAANGPAVVFDFELPKRVDLQAQIDAAAAKGGGRVTIPAGEWESAPITLKTGVELHLAEGATLYASTNINEYAEAAGARVFLYADHADKIAITGKGTLDGRGNVFKEKKGLAGESQPQNLPVLIRLSRCTNVRMEDFTYLRSGAWGCHLRNCDGVTVRRVTCFNHVNNTNDGIDIESRNVLIEDCEFDADDDALCIKTESDVTFQVTNIVVRNCRLASSCNALRAGSGSYCDVRDVLMENCVVTKPKDCWRFRWCDYVPGVTNRYSGMGVISFAVVDGGRLENLTVRNIEFEGCSSPIFFRLGERRPNKDGKGTYMRNVLVENVKGTVDGFVPCVVSGVPGLRPQNFVFRNIDITFPGGGKAGAPVPELVPAFPSQLMYGNNPLPAYGFYLRHADNIRFENVNIRTTEQDERPLLVSDDCTGVVGL